MIFKHWRLSVGALALSGLIAGCAGGGSPTTLPQTSQISDKTPQSEVVHFRAMSAAQFKQADALVRARIAQGSGGIHTQAKSSGVPTGFGFVMNTSIGGRFQGMQDHMTAYPVGTQPDPTVFELYTNFSAPGVPGGPFGGVGYSQAQSALYAPLDVPPGGACIFPYVGYFADSGANKVFQNVFGYLDECAKTGGYATIGPAFPVNGFNNQLPGKFQEPYTNASFGGRTFPNTIGVEVRARADGAWNLRLRDVTSYPGNYVTVYTSPVGTTNILNGAGASFWLETPLAIGACPPIPANGIGPQNLALFDTSTGSAAPVPLGSTGIGYGFNQPDPKTDTCFVPLGDGGVKYNVQANSDSFVVTSSGD